MSQSTYLIIPRPDVEDQNLQPFLNRFGPDKLPSGRKLAEMMGTFEFSILGYDDSPEELYSIQAVRDYYAQLDVEWPYLLFFASLRSDAFSILVSCLLTNISSRKVQGEADAMVEYDRRELLKFISGHFGGLNEMTDRAGMSERGNFNRTKDLFEYFGFEFEVPPPPE